MKEILISIGLDESFRICPDLLANLEALSVPQYGPYIPQAFQEIVILN